MKIEGDAQHQSDLEPYCFNITRFLECRVSHLRVCNFPPRPSSATKSSSTVFSKSYKLVIQIIQIRSLNQDSMAIGSTIGSTQSLNAWAATYSTHYHSLTRIFIPRNLS
jgi:hypothetical protein